jgi:exonuclease SbcC
MFRFDSCEIFAMGPFRRKVAIDFAAIPGPLIALVGPNGAGKTTFLECMAGGTLYRKTSRGPLADIATQRGAYVETKLMNGQGYTIRQTVDPLTRGGESLVLDETGKTVLDSAKVSVFDAWREKRHMPSPSVLYACLFTMQGDGGFLDMKEAEQKAVLLRVIGVEELELLAELARGEKKAAKQEFDVSIARIKDEKERGLDIAVAGAQLADAKERALVWQSTLVDAQAELALLQKKAAETESEIALQKRTEAELSAVEKELRDLRELGQTVAKRLANNRELVAQRREIESALAKDAVLLPQEAPARALVVKANDAMVKAEKELERQQANGREASTRKIAAERRAETFVARLSQRAAIARAAEELAAAQSRLADAELQQSLAWESLEAANGLALHVAEKRVGVLRPAVQEIADAAVDAYDANGVACDAIYGDDQILIEAGQASIAEAEAVYAEASRAVDHLRAEVQKRERLAARADAILQAEADLKLARDEECAAEADITAAERGQKLARQALNQAEAALAGERAALSRIEQERTSLAPLVKRQEVLAVADAKIVELEPQLRAITPKVADAEERRGALVARLSERALTPVDLGPIEKKVAWATGEAQHASSMIAVAEARAAMAKESAEKLAKLEKERLSHLETIADWTLIAEALGRDGIQALEIDAAGPELTELINDLLTTCLGTRWSVLVATTRESDGRQLEDLQMLVTDAETAREGPAWMLSGGEKVLVSEAISLSLMMLACRRAGVEGPTLIRDESGAHLDAEKAPIYITMLRHAAEMIGARHVLFVSHDTNVQRLADERIYFDKDGQVRVGDAA